MKENSYGLLELCVVDLKTKPQAILGNTKGNELICTFHECICPSEILNSKIYSLVGWYLGMRFLASD